MIHHTIIVDGNRKSICLEKEMWTAFQEISVREKLSIDELSTLIFQNRKSTGALPNCIRMFIMNYFRAAATSEGHRAAGHGGGNGGEVVASLIEKNASVPYYGVRDLNLMLQDFNGKEK